jgi:hypothetical protein
VANPLCRDVRSYLASLAGSSGSSPASTEVWTALANHGAVSGTADAPALTDVGRHVLKELEIRAYRTDGTGLDEAAGQIGRLLWEFDEVAKHAEYFLADLGPVTPPIALPLLRPVSVQLANRRETPEELAEGFRNVWGGVEVMGGDPRDRLLAAELLNGVSADMGKVYSPIMNTTEMIRKELGTRVAAVTPATLLHLTAGEGNPIPFKAYLDLRSSAGSDEAAALLAAMLPDPSAALARRDRFLRGLGAASRPSSDALHAATYLAAMGADDQLAASTLAIGTALGTRSASPLTPAALLSSHVHLSPEEIVDWVDKAAEVATRRQLAPTPREIGALAIGLVHGLPESEFLRPSAPGTRAVGAPATLPALTAFHAWIYRPLVAATGPVASSAAPVP